jgi:hypothetical protein
MQDGAQDAPPRPSGQLLSFIDRSRVVPDWNFDDLITLAQQSARNLGIEIESVAL